MSEQPYGPGAFCEDCGHFAGRHDSDGCGWVSAKVQNLIDLFGDDLPPKAERCCPCAGMLWLGTRWPRPWLPAPDGLAVR